MAGFFVKGTACSVAVAILAGCGGGGSGDVTGPTVALEAVAAAGTPLTSVNSGAALTAPQLNTWQRLNASSVTLEDFDATNSTAQWRYLDAYIPVAYRGSISLGGGFGSLNSGVLRYDLGCGITRFEYRAGMQCGTAVGMKKVFTPVVPTSSTPAISFDIRNPKSSGVVEMTVTDSTGQTLQYRFDPRTFENNNGSDWAHLHVPLSKTRFHYGGANDGVFRGGIAAISFGMTAGGMHTPQDELQVDNIRLQSDSRFSFSLRSDASLVPGTYYPTYVGRLAIAAHQLDPQALDKVKEVGINIIRRDLKWADVEVNGTYQFGGYDRWMDAAAARGMSMLWILDYGHPDHGGRVPLAAADRAAYAAFARAAASRYRGRNVLAYEVWNEPDVPTFWPSPDPNAYAQLFQDTVNSIKGVDSSIKVVTGGVGIDGLQTLGYFTRMVQSGKVASADAISVHPYRLRKPEAFSADIQPLKNILGSHQLNKKLWVTEWGYSAYGYFDASVYGDGHDSRALNRQAVLTLRQVLTQLTLDLPVMTLYNIKDSGNNATDREHNFGLLEEDFSDKPSMTALRTLHAVASGRVFKGPLRDVPPVMHGVRWDGSADKVFALWTDTPEATVTVTLPANATVVKRWNGQTVSPTTTSSGRTITLREEEGPVFVTVPN